jgi:acyl transferase domain-containing protein
MEPPAPIAIIGIGCRFSGGADSPEKLWKVLSEGESTWSPIPAKRWNAAAFFDANPEKQGMHNTRGGHFVEYDIAAFDAGFWGIPPAECEAMDPQHRLQLEMVYEALENAGITRQEVEGSNTAVYIATFSEDYKAIQQKDINDIPRYNTIGTGTSIAANRISYQLDLRGPSVTLGESSDLICQVLH